MSDPLYKKELLRLAAEAHGAGTLAEPHLTGMAFNPACGDRVTMQVRLDTDGNTAALAHETKACVLAQASASILGRDAPRHSRDEIIRLRDDVASMLKGSAFDSVYLVFDGVTDHTSRHSCVLLPFDALLTAFNDRK